MSPEAGFRNAPVFKVCKDNPCTKDCPDRTAGCHATCEKRRAWKAKWDSEKAQERKKKLKGDSWTIGRERKVRESIR